MGSVAENLKRRYGLTPVQRQLMWEQQQRRCAICFEFVPLEGGPKAGSINVDHDHATGIVRGLLCSSCNRGLGFFGDDPLRLRQAWQYLEGTKVLTSR